MIYRIMLRMSLQHNFRVVKSKIQSGRFAIKLTQAALLTGSVFFFRKELVISGSVKPPVQIALKQQRVINLPFFQRMTAYVIHFFRFVHLLIIFMPAILLLPLVLFNRTKGYWMDCFIKGVERAGVIWIKAFQYLSHRRDIIGPEMAEKTKYLRENVPTHSYANTVKILQQEYGKNAQQIFEEFNPKPIASGSVSQVYQATYKGKKVIVKVRHPGVQDYIQRDVNLLFFFSYIASCISPAMEIPVTEVSLKGMLTGQIDFVQQMNNLNIFNEMFKGSASLKFPIPVAELTTSSVLVESFAEGMNVNYYEENRHTMNPLIARIGAEAFYEMMMKNGFIHADCHGGNIIVNISERQYSPYESIRFELCMLYSTWVNRFKSFFLEKQFRKLFVENYIKEQQARKLAKNECRSVVATLIDAGMVIILDKIDKENFVSFIKAVTESNGLKCAEKIFTLSKFKGLKATKEEFPVYFQQLKQVFMALDGQPLQKLDGIRLSGEFLKVVRKYRMKLDGEFATLMTNMVVLQSIAKGLDPKINLLQVAAPFFKYAEQ